MAVARGIFRSARTAWIAVASYTVFLYATLSVSFDMYSFVYDRIGREAMSRWMNMMFVPVGLILLLFVLFFLPRKFGVYLSFSLICLGVALCLNLLTIPAKRFHFFQYAPLTVLVFDALRFSVKDHYLYVWTLAAVALLGLGDETIQWMLPSRYFGLTDVAVNAGAGLLTLAFIRFVLGEENYPWGPQKLKK
ncbi:MAG: VanZ family protein [Acidobacteriota bacterium]